MIDLGVDQQHCGDAAVADLPRRLQAGGFSHLLQNLGGGVDQQPVLAVGSACHRRLRACLSLDRAAAPTVAIGAVAVPLGEVAPLPKIPAPVDA